MLKQYIRRAAAAVLGIGGRRAAVSNTQLKMIRRFLPGESLLDIQLPSSYTLLEYRPGHEGEWTQFINQCGEFGFWDTKRLAEDIIEFLLPGGGILAVREDRIVGCASACHLKEHNPFATLMYVAVDAKDRGRGLGKALTYTALRICQQAGYMGIVLNTDDFRLSAIRTYLALGFVPYLVDLLNHGQRWQVVFRRLEGTAYHESNQAPSAAGAPQ